MKNNIRELREAHDMSQEALAQKLEVSRQTVNAIENDKYDPMLPLAFKIARVFGKAIEEVFQPERKKSGR
jgi:putative transcriptional regulator